jgi:GNAT superfamily N-acetyltransferase
MMTDQLDVSQLMTYPVTPERWADLETLFGSHGAYSGCWCMFWRLRRSEFAKMKSEDNKALLQRMVRNNEVPGILAYDHNQPIGWCSVDRRENYRALVNSRILKRIDNQPVWSIVCFFVDRRYRGKGIMTLLINGAIDYAVQQGAKIIESYPIDLQSPKLAGKNLTGCRGYMGIASTFKRIGFEEVGHASETHLIMRYYAIKDGCQ